MYSFIWQPCVSAVCVFFLFSTFATHLSLLGLWQCRPRLCRLLTWHFAEAFWTEKTRHETWSRWLVCWMFVGSKNGNEPTTLVDLLVLFTFLPIFVGLFHWTYDLLVDYPSSHNNHGSVKNGSLQQTVVTVQMQPFFIEPWLWEKGYQ